MKHIADPRRALWCVARRPCVVLSTFVLVTACDHVALPSQLVASGVTRPDTVARSPAADTVAATVDTAVAISVIDSSAVGALVLPTFRGRGLDDRDIGADIDRVEAATRGAVVAP